MCSAAETDGDVFWNFELVMILVENSGDPQSYCHSSWEEHERVNKMSWRYIHTTVVETSLTLNHKCQPHGDAKGKVRGSSKSLNFWELRMFVCDNPSITTVCTGWHVPSLWWTCAPFCCCKYSIVRHPQIRSWKQSPTNTQFTPIWVKFAKKLQCPAVLGNYFAFF